MVNYSEIIELAYIFFTPKSKLLNTIVSANGSPVSNRSLFPQQNSDTPGNTESIETPNIGDIAGFSTVGRITLVENVYT